jgi:hypothetical protein
MTDTLTEAWLAPPTPEATADDLAAVRATVLDYFEGWFDADPERMRRALHPALAKRSHGQDADRTPAVSSLTAEQMVAWTAAGHGRARAGAERAVEIRITDVSGTIASVMVRSAAYIEYVHLVATPDGWRIVNALWRYADGHGPAR